MSIADRQGNNTLRAREDLLRVDALMRVSIKVNHFSVLPFTQPSLEAQGRLRRLGGGKAAIIESQFLRALANTLFHLCFYFAMWN